MLKKFINKRRKWGKYVYVGIVVILVVAIAYVLLFRSKEGFDKNSTSTPNTSTPNKSSGQVGPNTSTPNTSTPNTSSGQIGPNTSTPNTSTPNKSSGQIGPNTSTPNTSTPNTSLQDFGFPNGGPTDPSGPMLKGSSYQIYPNIDPSMPMLKGSSDQIYPNIDPSGPMLEGSSDQKYLNSAPIIGLVSFNDVEFLVQYNNTNGLSILEGSSLTNICQNIKNTNGDPIQLENKGLDGINNIKMRGANTIRFDCNGPTYHIDIPHCTIDTSSNVI